MTDEQKKKHQEWIKERDEALLSFSREKIEAYLKKHGLDNDDEAVSDKVFWMGTCKAVLALKSADATQRMIASRMLEELRLHDEIYAKKFN